MNKSVVFEDLGLIDYKKAWDYQEQIFNNIIEYKTKGENQENVDNHILFCEHPHVYTLGKSGAQNNLLISDEFLKKINATYYKINRGGDITYHGPGQIVGYPILDLEQLNLGIKEYIEKLEEAIIQSLKYYGIESSRKEGATGVWLDVGNGNLERKICAIGVRAGRFVTMHGFALNVNTDLQYFNHINPCGFTDKQVTSIQKETGKEMDFEEVKEVVKKEILKILDISLK